MFLPCFASAILIILAFSVATKEDEVWMSNTRRWVGSTSAGGSEPGSRRCPLHHQGINKVTYQLMFQLNVYRHVFLHLQIRQFIRYADAISAISDSIKLRCDSSFDRRGLGDTKQVAMKLEAPLGAKSDTRGEHTKQGHRESVSNPWWRNYNTAVLGCRWTSIAGHAMRFQR